MDNKLRLSCWTSCFSLRLVMKEETNSSSSEEKKTKSVILTWIVGRWHLSPKALEQVNLFVCLFACCFFLRQVNTLLESFRANPSRGLRDGFDHYQRALQKQKWKTTRKNVTWPSGTSRKSPWEIASKSRSNSESVTCFLLSIWARASYKSPSSVNCESREKGRN